MISLGARLFRSLLRVYTYRRRKLHMSLSRTERPRNGKYMPPRGMTFAVRSFGGTKTEIFSPSAVNGDLIVMFHGGGHTQGMNDMYRRFAARLASAAMRDVYCIDYTPGDALVYPSVHDECFAAYKAIAESAKGRGVACIGDSFGAGLMLSCCLRLRDEGAPLPEKLVCVSCFADLAASGDSYRKNCYRDPMYALPRSQSFADNEHFVRRRTPYAGSNDVRDPYLSPAYADFRGFPPMLIVCGEYETSESDNRMVASGMERAGAEVTVLEFEGMFHDFPYIAPFLKESRRAMRAISDHIVRK